MKSKLIFLAIGLAAFQATSFAQGTKPAAPPPKPTPPPSTPPPDPTKTINPDWQNLLRTGRAGDILVGNVTLAGGALPWDPIPVTVTCDGKVSYTTNTDPKGVFAIARAESAGSKTIQANPKPVAAQFVGCTVDAALVGFNSNPLTIANRDVLESTNIGTITLQREAGSGDTSLSSTTAAAPGEATKLFEKARKDWLDNKPDRAQKDLQKAVEIYPQFAEAWYQLGKIQENSKSPEAWNSFSKAAAADPKFALPYEHLASLAGQTGKSKELLDATSHALELNPRGTINIWYYHALGNYQTGKIDVAEKSALKSLAMDPLHVQPNTEQLLAVILADKQDLAGALQHLRNCLTYFPPGPSLDLVKQQIAQIEPAVPAHK
jgi:tetratricopeptide (TPR) repeat protein